MARPIEHPVQAAARIERELAPLIKGVKDPLVRAEMERKIREARERLDSAAEEQPGEVVEKGFMDFFRDMAAGRRSRERLRHLRKSLRARGADVDDFGYDAVYWQEIQPRIRYLYDTYWRVETSGIENIPAEGRALIVANHSGLLPWDAVILREAVQIEHPNQRDLRPLIEDFAYALPYLSGFLRRAGIARADRRNAERMLREEKLVAVFPEGARGAAKMFRDRYRIQRFGRAGTVRLAIATQSPIIPAAIVGGEETHPVLAKSDLLAKWLGLPVFPITPTFPWLGPGGLVPLPSKWYVRFGEPIRPDRKAGADPGDEIRINQLNEALRQRIQKMVHDVLRERRSVWRG
ncbi:MAG: acyltransferase family protein [Deltaproteobacteria bacterium]|nr:acyltransferase family protein [Deltaproteobacteria bacterium]